MGKIFCKIMVLLISGLLCWCMRPAPGRCADQGMHDPEAVKKMEETIKQQEERIRQLQSEVNRPQPQSPKQQAGPGEVPVQPQTQTKEDAVEQALRESWGCCGANSRVVKVTDGLVSVYFNNIHDIITFFETGADPRARQDLVVFLKRAGLEKGTIEYYSADKKLYSVTGSLTKAETKQYY